MPSYSKLKKHRKNWSKPKLNVSKTTGEAGHLFNYQLSKKDTLLNKSINKAKTHDNRLLKKQSLKLEDQLDKMKTTITKT